MLHCRAVYLRARHGTLLAAVMITLLLDHLLCKCFFATAGAVLRKAKTWLSMPTYAQTPKKSHAFVSKYLETIEVDRGKMSHYSGDGGGSVFTSCLLFAIADEYVLRRKR